MEDQYIQISPNVRVNQTIINRRSEEAVKKAKEEYEKLINKNKASKKTY